MRVANIPRLAKRAMTCDQFAPGAILRPASGHQDLFLNTNEGSVVCLHTGVVVRDAPQGVLYIDVTGQYVINPTVLPIGSGRKRLHPLSAFASGRLLRPVGGRLCLKTDEDFTVDIGCGTAHHPGGADEATMYADVTDTYLVSPCVL